MFPVLLLPCASDAIDHWRAFGSENELHHLGEDKTGDGGLKSRPKEKSISDVGWYVFTRGERRGENGIQRVDKARG